MLRGIFHLVSRFSCNIADNSVNLHYFTVLLFAITIIACFVELSQFYFDFSLLVRLREKSEVPTSDIYNKNVLTSPLTPKNSKNSANTVYLLLYTIYYILLYLLLYTIYYYTYYYILYTIYYYTYC